MKMGENCSIRATLLGYICLNVGPSQIRPNEAKAQSTFIIQVIKSSFQSYPGKTI
jgi:hypothetical protein